MRAASLISECDLALWPGSGGGLLGAGSCIFVPPLGLGLSPVYRHAHDLLENEWEHARLVQVHASPACFSCLSKNGSTNVGEPQGRAWLFQPK